MKNTPIQVAGATMTSVDLVAIINDLREKGRAVLEHSDFLKKIEKVLGGGDPARRGGVMISRTNGQPGGCTDAPATISRTAPGSACVAQCSDANNDLTVRPVLINTQNVPEKEGNGFGDLNTYSGQTAQCGFFTSVYPWHSFNGGLGGDTFGYAGGCRCRFANPVQFRHHHLAMMGGLTATYGGSHA